MVFQRLLLVAVFSGLATAANAQLIDESLDGSTWTIVTGDDPTSVIVEPLGRRIRVSVTSYRLDDLQGRHITDLTDQELIDLVDTMDTQIRVARGISVIKCTMGSSGDFFFADAGLPVWVDVAGGAGKDVLAGTEHADILEGGPDADFLVGGPGKDVLFGGADGVQDTLLGGPDADQFFVGQVCQWQRAKQGKGPGDKKPEGLEGEKESVTLPDDLLWRLFKRGLVISEDGWVEQNIDLSEPIVDVENLPVLEWACEYEDVILDFDDEEDSLFLVPVEN